MDINLLELALAGDLEEYSTQAKSEAKLSVPPGLPDIKQVLYTAGKARLLGAEAAHGRILMDGNVVFTVCYLSGEDTLESWSSSAAFKTTMDADDATPESVIHALTQVAETEAVQGGPREIYIKSLIDIKAYLINNEKIMTLDPGDAALITRSQKRGINSVKDVKSRVVPVREDVRLPSEITDVIFSTGYPVVGSVVFDDNACAVSGEIVVSALCKTDEKSLPVRLHSALIPFAELFTLDNYAEGDMARVCAAIDELDAKAIEGEGNLLSVNGILNLRLIVSSKQEKDIISDAYSSKSKISVDKRTYKFTGDSFNTTARKDLALSADMAGAPAGEAVVTATPYIVWTKCRQDAIEVEGMADVCAIYDNTGIAACRKLELPFAFELEAPGVDSESKAYLTAGVRECTGDISGGKLNVRLTLDFDIQAFVREDIELAVNATDTGEDISVEPGVYIYFANGDESLFDVAKRYLTTEERLRALNPDTGDGLYEGQKLLVKI